MRDRRQRVTRGARDRHGSVTEGARRHREREKSTLPCVLHNTEFTAACIDPPIGALMHAACSGPPRNRHGRPRKPTEGARGCGVLTLCVTDPAEVCPLTHGPSAKPTLPPVL